MESDVASFIDVGIFLKRTTLKYLNVLFLCVNVGSSKGLFIWRRVVSGKRVALHTEPPRARNVSLYMKKLRTVYMRNCKVGSGG